MSILSIYKQFWSLYASEDSFVDPSLLSIIESHIRIKEPTYKKVLAFHEGHVTIETEQGVKDLSIVSLLIDKKP